jgi:hypothetical protein
MFVQSDLSPFSSVITVVYAFYEAKRKTQERMERKSRKRYSSAGSEEMERVGDR